MAAYYAAPTGAGRRAGALHLIGNEVAKGLQVMWSRKMALVPQFAIMIAMYWALQFMIGGGRIVEDLVAVTLLGYWAYVVGYLALLRMAAGVLEEKFSGTLEQSLLSPLSPWLLSVGRVCAAVVEGVLTALVVSGLTLIVLDVDVPFTPAALVPLVLTLVDLAGFALLIGGVALVVNSIGSVIHVIQSTLVLLNGALIPVYVFPPWLAIVAKFAPSTLGIDVGRRMLFSGRSLAEVWADGSLPLALAHAALMLLTGWLVYHAAIRRGMRLGRLGA